MRYTSIHFLFLMAVGCASCGQTRPDEKKIIINSETVGVSSSQGPTGITRNVIQDKRGNIWIAAFDGIFKYDGRTFTNITSNITNARFFSVLEDRKGNLWFGSVGSGVYLFDRKSFENFTTQQGLLNNEVTSIYEDKKGNIWFGVSGGVSRYDGRSFKNYIMNGTTMSEDLTGKTFLVRQPYEVTSILEDKNGKFWFATRGNTFMYDGKTCSVFTKGGITLKNVRTVIEDKMGNIWLGGANGLWRYNGSTLTNLTRDFVGHVYEDKQGNIWTSSQKANEGKCVLSRYDNKSLNDKKPIVTEITSKYDGNKGMIFGITQAADGNIWFGSMTGVHSYDGKTIINFDDRKGETYGGYKAF